jgi:Clp amino terminal domain, pathogenicity island component
MHLAKCEADGFGADQVEPEHILLALLSDAALVSSTMEGVSPSDIRASINAHALRREPKPLPHDLPLSAESRTAMARATEEATARVSNMCGMSTFCWHWPNLIPATLLSYSKNKVFPSINFDSR